MKYLYPRNGHAPFLAGRCRRGFTLIELMLVLTVCVVLAGIAIPRLLNVVYAAKL